MASPVNDDDFARLTTVLPIVVMSPIENDHLTGLALVLPVATAVPFVYYNDLTTVLVMIVMPISVTDYDDVPVAPLMMAIPRKSHRYRTKGEYPHQRPS